MSEDNELERLKTKRLEEMRKNLLLSRRKKKLPHHKKNKKIRNHLHARLSSSG